MANFSGLFGTDHALIDGRQPSRSVLRRMVLKSGFRKTRELFATLVGAAPGETAQLAYKRVAHDADASGNIDIEQVTVINRATSAGDETALHEISNVVARAPNYPADASGNGGAAFNPGFANPTFGDPAAVVDDGDVVDFYVLGVTAGAIDSIDESNVFAIDSYTAVAGDATASEITIDTGIDVSAALTSLVVDITRAGASVKLDAVVTDNEDGTFTISELVTYDVTAGDVVNWAAMR